MSTVGGSTGASVERLHRVAPVAAWLLFAAAVVTLGLSAWSDIAFFERWGDAYGVPASWLRDRLGFHGALVLLLAYPFVGAIIASRRPRHPIGWLLVVGGVMFAVDTLAGSYSRLALAGDPVDPSAAGLVAAGMRNWTFTAFTATALILVPLVFPDGRLPSRRWRPAPWIVGTLLIFEVARRALSGRFVGTVDAGPAAGTVVVFDVPNPLGVAAWLVDGFGGRIIEVVAIGTFFVLVGAAVFAVVSRYRRSAGVRRQQLKWFVFAILLWVAALGFTLAVESLAEDPPGAMNLIWMIPVALVPASIGVAVLRHRLYEIDRIISRTVTYGLVVAVLGAVYVAGVVGLGAVVSGFAGEQGGDLVVAVSVLTVVALFRPVTSRVQQAVDRRFNRSGYEARLAVESFTQRARDDVELEAITRGVAETAAVVVQPEHVSVWVADQEAVA